MNIFADLKDDFQIDVTSDEGILKWFKLNEISQLEMPFTAKYMLEHYLSTGIQNDKTYVGVADGTKVVFTEMPAF